MLDLGSRYRTPLSVETRASLRDIQPCISIEHMVCGRFGKVHVVTSVPHHMLLALIKHSRETNRERE
jgi:hypothetical protein